MPKSKKANSRQSRREERAQARHVSRTNALLDTSLPVLPEQASSKPVTALTPGQKAYDAAFKSSDIVFGVGPAGTGKTWFAVQRAARALKDKKISKIYVTRPTVEVGASLGFLPGELEDKFAPYIAPLKEAFVEALGSGYYEYCLKVGKIEPVPLAFMRGRTIKDAWLIADEMQNATHLEFKMLLTRIGENAKFVINGDPSQIDQGIISGLEDAMDRTRPYKEVKVVEFNRSEIVRSGLAQQMVEAYEGA